MENCTREWHGKRQISETQLSQLLRGAKPKAISGALGHSSVAFTMDTYSHIISGMQEEAMALLDEVLPSGAARSTAVA